MRRVCLTLGGVYVLLRVGAVVGAAPVSAYPDSQEYLATAHHSLFSSGFWAGSRGPGIPLLYKLLSTNHLREAGQLALSVLAWLGLAVACLRAVRHPKVKIAAFACVLLFSLSPWIMQWDPVLLSESLSLTFTAGLIALWLELIRRPSGRKVAGLLALAFLWATARDPNSYLLLFALVVPAVWLVRSRERRLPAVVLVGLLAIAVGALASSNAGERWKVPLVDIVGHRILPNSEATRFFRDRGMPELPPQLVAGLRTPGYIDHAELRRLPGWRDFDGWLDHAGRETYVGYLATHPGDAISTAVGERRYLLTVHPSPAPANSPLEDYRAAGTTEVLPSWVSELLFPPNAGQMWLSFVLLAAALLLMWRRRWRTPQWTVPVALVALAIPHALIVALSDTNEPTRHALLLMVTLRLAVLLAAVFLLDAYLEGRRGDRTTEPRRDWSRRPGFRRPSQSEPSARSRRNVVTLTSTAAKATIRAAPST